MRTLIDIGSMDGREIEWGLKHGYEVHAFEPNLNCKKWLEKYENRAKINYSGAWYFDGVMPLWIMQSPEPGEDGVSLIYDKLNVSKTDSVSVQVVNIGKYLRELNKDIDILKINAEGSEYIILESILNEFDYRRIKHWLVEDHGNYINTKNWIDHRSEVLTRMSNLGIKVNHYNYLESLEKVNG